MDRERRDTTTVLIYRIVAFEFATHHCLLQDLPSQPLLSPKEQ